MPLNTSCDNTQEVLITVTGVPAGAALPGPLTVAVGSGDGTAGPVTVVDPTTSTFLAISGTVAGDTVYNLTSGTLTDAVTLSVTALATALNETAGAPAPKV